MGLGYRRGGPIGNGRLSQHRWVLRGSLGAPKSLVLRGSKPKIVPSCWQKTNAFHVRDCNQLTPLRFSIVVL